MRIISGQSRGRQLVTFQGKDIRPTSDRVREAIFSILTSKLGSFNGIHVLELFAGTGALSLETLSRGAKSAILVDSGDKAAAIITENIKRCHCESEAKLINQTVTAASAQLLRFAPFDLILLDPPYDQNLLTATIKQIESLNLLAKNGIICAESSRKETLGDFESLALIDARAYGSTRIHFLRSI